MPRTLNRRQFLKLLTTVVASSELPWAHAMGNVDGLKFGAPVHFSWDKLIEQAQHMASQAFQPELQPDLALLEHIDWASHGKIRFKSQDALFVDGPGQYPIEFFPPGRFFQNKVQMFRLDQALDDATPNTMAREVLFNAQHFDMPSDSPAQHFGPQTGYAGFRIQESRYSKNPSLDWENNDWAAFLGASYFRAIGDEYQYGISARGIAINVVEPQQPEEFPAFTQFYFSPSATNSRTMVVFAFLDGPSITGAYRFDITRDVDVVMEIESKLFLRKDVARFGIAPATSMYWFSEKDKQFQIDWRPEVHDSDGLALWTGANEHIWRPLINPKEVNVSSFTDTNPRGFGLMQRARQSSDYLDSVHYERRPSLWIEPLGNWGAGSIQLVEIPADEEIYDNIVAMWVPAKSAQAGNSYHLHYRLHWQSDMPFPTPLAKCVATRIGRGGEPANRPPNTHKFEVTFNGSTLQQLAIDVKPEAVVTCSRGQILNIATEPSPNATSGQWRAFFDLNLAETDITPVEIRLFLRDGAQTLSETWLYQYHTDAM